jgi:hypothetical protein
MFFYCRDAVCEFVFSQAAVPVNPFRVFEYFLGDRVDRDLVRQGNNNLIRIADELWVFGDMIADGVFSEILLARHLDKPIRYFSIHNRASEIHEIEPTTLKFERELLRARRRDRNELLMMVLGCDPAAPAPVQLDLLIPEKDADDTTRSTSLPSLP